ncbi:hypothetical protein PHYPSEUDO_012335 [Phytophthora pseudosyringae]|uniref:BZIP domain-containing protein n=1 Tax=Phytophthora pseudosyringae TaxID=221518 RepID=A0A8T1VA62_9STRA|nr:hypothetical protein PHYPSEUDO_012335 [Phytophthora pseudosyringae]
MNKRDLRPPSSHALSAAGIDEAIDSKRPARDIEVTEVSTGGSTRPSFRFPKPPRPPEWALATELAKTHLGDISAGVAVDRRTTAAKLPSLLTLQQQQPSVCGHTLSTEATTGTTTTSSAEPTNPYDETIQQVIAEKERIRELRRQRQVRYRTKKHNYMLSLEDEAKLLREEIKNLELRRHSLSAVVPAEQNIWHVAVEYFNLFRFGLPADMQVSTNVAAIASAQSCVHLRFLHAAMAPDVIFNAHQGIEAMIASWRCNTLAFQALEVELEGVVKTADGSLVATTRTSFNIPEQTLRSVFTHLCDDGDEELSRIAGELVGHRFHLRGSARFEWDAGRVSRIMAQSDMLTPTLQLLGSLERVSRVFEKSRISSDFQWRGGAYQNATCSR